MATSKSLTSSSFSGEEEEANDEGGRGLDVMEDSLLEGTSQVHIIKGLKGMQLKG